MADVNIDGTVQGTGLFNTKIPGYEDAADIQAALRLYHYGSSIYNGANTDPAQLEQTSIAYYLNSLKTRIKAQEDLGVGSDYSATKPTSPVEGYIWVDSSSTATTSAVQAAAKYQTTAPTTELSVGALWVDSDSSPLKMYVYSGTEWKEIGA